MRKKGLVGGRSLLVAVLVLAMIVPAAAKNADPCSMEKKLIELLEQKLKDKDAQLAEKDKLITLLEEDKKDLETLKSHLEAQVAELQKQGQLQEEIKQLKQENIDTHKKMLENCEQRIRARDEVIKELAKGAKESTLRKIAESIPVVAGIIAVAIASK